MTPLLKAKRAVEEVRWSAEGDGNLVKAVDELIVLRNLTVDLLKSAESSAGNRTVPSDDDKMQNLEKRVEVLEGVVECLIRCIEKTSHDLQDCRTALEKGEDVFWASRPANQT